MGINDVLGAYKPHDNDAKRPLIGDCIAVIEEMRIIEKKETGWKGFVLQGNAINILPPREGREVTIEPGAEVSKIYSDNERGIKDLLNDLFTAGIDYVPGKTDDETISNIAEAVKGKLVYLRCWMGDKQEKQADGTWKAVEGGEKSVQRVNIKSKKLITPELSVPQIPF